MLMRVNVLEQDFIAHPSSSWMWYTFVRQSSLKDPGEFSKERISHQILNRNDSNRFTLL